MEKFIMKDELRKNISKQTLLLMENVRKECLDRQSQIFEAALSEICTVFPQALNL